MLIVYLAIFYALQIGANAAFKYGSHGKAGVSTLWLTGFVGGNALGVGSMYFLMKIYEAMRGNCNVAAALATGGSFAGCQICLALVFRSRLTRAQWLGVTLVAIGLAVATLGGAS